MAATNKELFEQSNAAFAESFDKGHLESPPARQILVLTCMDARIDPIKTLGLDIGDAHVVRNAGGRASGDALRSITISQRLLGTKEVHIIHHTDCGMLTFKNDDLVAKIEADLGTEAKDAASGKDFLTFTNLEKSVRDDIQTVKDNPLVAPGTIVHGYIYDVRTGAVKEV